tara:strand:- start:1079 stop:1555 length:477 start_codon:yes stop_codon:yes gene_type:complete
MRYCQNCGKYACPGHMLGAVYSYGDLCIDCSRGFKKSHYGIGNIWFRKKKGSTEFNIKKKTTLDIIPKKIDKVYSVIKQFMKNKLLIQDKKPNTLKYVDKGREINIKLKEENNKLTLEIGWKSEYGIIFSEKDFKKFDTESKKIIKKIESKLKVTIQK